MDEFEFAYYLNNRQLLLLLSLVDQRPVAGLPPVEEPVDWPAVSLSLLEDGRLFYRDGQLVMGGELSALLLAVKAARRVRTLHGKGTNPLTFYEGGRTVMLELLPGGSCRLGEVENSEPRRLTQERLFSRNPLPEALLDTLPEDEDLRARLVRWAHMGLSLEAPPGAWLGLEEVRGVVDLLAPERRDRWIWVEDAFTGLILHQDRDGTRVELDTPSRRRTLARELDWEAYYAAG